ncbi:MAG: type I DNA topoisomerase [Clostridia bacterium]|nr:type I DNA topoisomerase [Clostridia bacterium]
MNLVIVESPHKSNTIKSFLGSNYKVVASKGHIRDLPKSTLGIDIDDNFSAHYINIRGKGDLIRDLKKEAKKATKVYLAPDPDREGEAISWHLVTALEIPKEKVKRITFNEVTKNAVKEAIKHPRDVDMDLVNAQQTRRILDRIVGYKLSPFLWKNVKSGLSAGRVQSVVTRIIVEREEEIRAFVPVEFWTVDANVKNPSGAEFTLHYFGKASGNKKNTVGNGKEAEKIASDVKCGEFTVTEVKSGTKVRVPAPPFTTSTLQQEASRKLNYQTSKTMKVAQELYEGVNVGAADGGMQGLITYMRTDSLRISDEAKTAAKQYIIDKYGKEYYPKNPRDYKAKAGAQDAHEAIRPSNLNLDPAKIKKSLSPDQYKLYKLIWDRFFASQMQSAEISTVNCVAVSGSHAFHASGSTVKFPGFLALYEESTDDLEKADYNNGKLPAIAEGDKLELVSVDPEKHFTEPPARYTEGSLVKFLEEKGIGRPSTYNTIISIVFTRGYVKRDGKSLVPTPLGEITTKLMKDCFPDIVDYEYTAQMEEKLDDIERGKASLESTLSEFYSDFSGELESAESKAVPGKYELPVEETDLICENCGVKMIVKSGRFGKFAACPNYPRCRNTKQIGADNANSASVADKTADVSVKQELETAPFKCELCGSDMVLRNGRFGEFYACVRYPKCKFTKQKSNKIEAACPKCGGELVSKRGKNRTVFFSCSNYPECDFSSWDMPLPEKCPECGMMLFKKKGKGTVYCKNCDYQKES